MSFINDLKNIVDNYETDNCKTEIVEFAIIDSGGTILNTGETFLFAVKVTNKNHIDMKNVKVIVRGTHYADVALMGGLFGAHAISGSFNLDGHQSYTTCFFQGKAKKVTNGTKDIATAGIYQWDASLDNLLIDHTGVCAPEGKLNIDIQADFTGVNVPKCVSIAQLC